MRNYDAEIFLVLLCGLATLLALGELPEFHSVTIEEKPEFGWSALAPLMSAFIAFVALIVAVRNNNRADEQFRRQHAPLLQVYSIVPTDRKAIVVKNKGFGTAKLTDVKLEFGGRHTSGNLADIITFEELNGRRLDFWATWWDFSKSENYMAPNEQITILELNKAAVTHVKNQSVVGGVDPDDVLAELHELIDNGTIRIEVSYTDILNEELSVNTAVLSDEWR